MASRKELEDQVKSLGTQFTGLSDKLTELTEVVLMVANNMPTATQAPAPVEPAADVFPEDAAESQPKMRQVDLPPSGTIADGLPVPRKWRDVVTEVLGSDFSLDVADSSGGNYVITITIPDEWDRRVGNRKGRDYSTGLVRRATDLADVEKWCNMIRSNIQKTYPKFKK